MTLLLVVTSGLGLVLTVPGLVLARAARLDALRGLCLAPSLGVPMVLVAGLTTGLLGLSWSLPTAVLAIASITLLTALVVRWSARKRPSRRPLRPELSEWLGLLVGLAVSGAASLTVLAPVLLDPNGIAQQPDTLFHLGATRWLGDHHSGSMLDVTRWQGDPFLYPGAFQVLSGSLAGWWHLGPAVAAHAVVLVVLLLVWPLATMSLVGLLRRRHDVRAVSVGALGVTSTWFVAFPYLFLGAGVLWSNFLAFALVPAALSLLGAALRRPDPPHEPLEVRPAVALMAVVLVAIGSAQPNGLFSFVLLGYPIVALAWVGRARRRGAKQVVGTVTASLAGALLGCLLLVVIAPQNLLDNGPRRTGDAWRVAVSLAAKLGEANLILAVIPSLMVVAGALLSLRRADLLWLPVGLGVSAGLFLAADMTPGTVSRYVTWPWWTDWVRLLAMLAMVAAWAAGAGLSVVAARVWRMSGPIRAIPAVMITSAALMVSLTTARAHEVGVDSTYQPSKPASWWVTPAEIEALEVIGGSIPDGAGVAADPYLGGSYLAVTDGARTMFSTTVVPGDDQLLVAGHVGDMASSPQVCAAAQRLGLAFVLTGGDPQSSVPRPDPYAGLGAVTDDPSFPVVARAGPYALHAVPRCDAG